MSVKIMSKCWEITGITHTQKIVLLSLADQANDDGLCWPSTQSTSDRVGLCQRATRKAIAELEELGHLSRKFQTGRPTYYNIHPGMSCLPNNKKTPAPRLTDPGTECTPAQNAPRHLDSLTPAPHAYTPAPRLTDPGTSTQYNRKESSLTVIEPVVDVAKQQLATTSQNQITPSWLPDMPEHDFRELCKVRGVRIDPYSPANLSEFRLHWQDTGQKRTPSQWVNTYVKSLITKQALDTRIPTEAGPPKTFAEKTQDYKDKQAEKAFATLLTMSDEERKAWGF